MKVNNPLFIISNSMSPHNTTDNILAFQLKLKGKMIRTAIRVNPSSYESNYIGLDSDIKEVFLRNENNQNDEHHVDSWIFDEIYDIQNSQMKTPKFSAQEDVYGNFNKWMTKSSSTLLYCIVLGGKSTGKSYTLFGDNSTENQGLVPNLIHSLFEPNNNDTVLVQVSQCLSFSDHFVDLLKPPTKHYYTNQVGYSPSLGVFLLPLKSILCTTLEQALHALHLGLVSAAMISLNSHDLFNTAHLITTLRIVTSQRSYTVTFIELSTIIFYPTCFTESDRLSSSCLEINCTNSLAFCGLYGDASKEDINGYHHKSNQSIRTLLQLTGPYETSFLTYLLQDALSLRSPTHQQHHSNLSVDQRPSTYVIGCINSSKSSLSDIKITLDLIHSISERSHLYEKTQQKVEIESNEELPLSLSARRPSTTQVEPPIQFKSITDLIDDLNIEIEKISLLLDQLEEEKRALEETPFQSGQTFQTLMTNLLTLKSFNETKISYLILFKDILTRPYHFRNHFVENTIEEIVAIQKWLKSRGLIGLKGISATSATSTGGANTSADDMNNDEIKGNEGREDSGGKKNKSSSVPWCSSLITLTDPHLTPITSLNISNHFLKLLIPPGHMAICYESLRENSSKGSVKLSFPGIKHCKIFKLDGYNIRPKHCIIFRLGSTIKIRPLPNEDEEVVVVSVNGREITEETRLYHLDTVRLGLDCLFMVHIPVKDEELEEKQEETSQSTRRDELNLHTIYSPSIISSNILVNSFELSLDSWSRCIVSGLQGDLLSFFSTHLMNINHYNHSALDRQLIPILKISELTDDMKLTQYAPPIAQVQSLISTLPSDHQTTLVELLIAVKQMNFIANELRRLVAYEVSLTKITPSSGIQSSLLLRQYNGLEGGIVLGNEIYNIQVRCEVLDGNKKSGKGDSWVWSTVIFLQRYLQIQKMFVDFHEKYESNLELMDEDFPPAKDPFYDPSLPELIGVSTLHIDSLYHLIDTRDTLPIITFKGNHGGQLKLHVRIWIDKVETVPSYITVDKESKLLDFMGKMAILRFYFEYLFDIPPSLSNDLQIIFTFFGHTGQYRTTRSPAMNVTSGDKHAYINSILVIEQKITPDFVRYVQRNSIEFEIWGTRLSNRQYVPASSMMGKLIRVGEPVRMKKRGRKVNIESKNNEMGSGQPEITSEGEEEVEGEGEEQEEEEKIKQKRVEDEDDPVELKNKLKEMAFQLEKAEKNMKRTTKTASTYRDELSRINSKSVLKDQTITAIATEKDSKINELENKLRQMKEEIAEKERLLRVANEEKKPKSKVCIIS